MLKIYLYKVYRKILKSLPRFDAECFYVLDIEKINTENINETYSIINENNIPLFPAKYKEKFERFNAQKKVGYCYIKDSEHFAFVWVEKGAMNITEIGKIIPIKEGEAWTFHGFASEEYRSKGIFIQLRREVMKALHAENISKIHCSTSIHNIKAQNLLKRLNYVPYHKYYTITIFEKSFCYFSKKVTH